MNWKGIAAVFALAGTGFAACVAGGSGNAEASTSASARAVLIDREGRRVGMAVLSEQENGVLISVEVAGLPAGSKGFHIHETGLCETPTFGSAGAHFNPSSQRHGMENPSGPHAGDLPNIRIGEDGTGELRFLNPYISLTGENALLDADGAALMIHAGPDDYYTDPAGDSGDRIACGVIERS
jgi:Cu-Zn family superoxide dismutase